MTLSLRQAGLHDAVRAFVATLPTTDIATTADAERDGRVNCEYITPLPLMPGETVVDAESGECPELGVVNIIYDEQDSVACPAHALQLLAWSLEMKRCKGSC